MSHRVLIRSDSPRILRAEAVKVEKLEDLLIEVIEIHDDDARRAPRPRSHPKRKRCDCLWCQRAKAVIAGDDDA